MFYNPAQLRSAARGAQTPGLSKRQRRQARRIVRDLPRLEAEQQRRLEAEQLPRGWKCRPYCNVCWGVPSGVPYACCGNKCWSTEGMKPIY